MEKNTHILLSRFQYSMEPSKGRHFILTKRPKRKFNSLRKRLERLKKGMQEISKEQQIIKEGQRQVRANFEEIEEEQFIPKRSLQMNNSSADFGPFNGSIPTGVDVINIQNNNGSSASNNSKYIWGGFGGVVVLVAIIFMLFKHLKSGSGSGSDFGCNFSCKGSCQINTSVDHSKICDNV